METLTSVVGPPPPLFLSYTIGITLLITPETEFKLQIQKWGEQIGNVTGHHQSHPGHRATLKQSLDGRHQNPDLTVKAGRPSLL